jgi:predicted nucleic acid-binding protein
VIAFLDTSAVVPLLIEEPGSERCRRVWDSADTVVCTELVYVETAAALARATRLGRMTWETRTDRLARLEVLWGELVVLPVDEFLIRSAVALTAEFPLRGYDSVHCAAGLRLADRDMATVSGDRELLSAWRALGLDVIDTLT